MKHTAVIIEDEIPARLTLKTYLAKYFENIDVIAEIDNVKDAIDFLVREDADILFLDVQLRDGKAIEILDAIDVNKYKLVFTTAYNEYAIDAFKHKSFGYLLKPLDPNDFREIVGRVLNDLVNSSKQKKIKIPLNSGYKIIDVQDVIRCESESNYTKIYINNEPNPYLISKTLKSVEKEIIDSPLFFRIHRSHLINSNYIKSSEVKNNTIMLLNGTAIPVSRGHYKELEALLSNRS
jgi:two-component system, LytTR family, response regulator